MRVLGLMSGTSLDGIDVALCEFEPDAEKPAGSVLRLRDYREVAHPLRDRILSVLHDGTARLDEITELNFLLGAAFADAAHEALSAMNEAAPDLIASHGQTMYHLVAPRRIRSTLQLGEPAVIAERTGTTVVADFRVADMAAGGQGAPLASSFDALFFAHPERTRAVQNIGGIANATFVPPGAPQAAYAFDTGPGNMLIDHAARYYSGGASRCDRNGAMAAAGTVNLALLEEILAHPYFSRPPPRTTGREEFGDAYAESVVARAHEIGAPPRDVLATLTALTAESIARAYRDFGPRRIDDVIISGGGARNPTLVRELGARLPGVPILHHDAFGIPAEAKEAVAFAFLGYEALHGRAASLPRCTGAAHRSILGKIVPGANYRALMTRVGADGREEWQWSRTLRLHPWTPSAATPTQRRST